MRNFFRQMKEDVYEWLDPASCVQRREIPGGTGPQRVQERIQEARKELGL
jgi:argininosuccinate lyase